MLIRFLIMSRQEFLTSCHASRHRSEYFPNNLDKKSFSIRAVWYLHLVILHFHLQQCQRKSQESEHLSLVCMEPG